MELDVTLRAIRRDLRISQRQLAELTGVSRATIERLEAGRCDCSVAVLERIVAGVGLELAVLLRGGCRLRSDEAHDAARQRDGRRFPAHLPWSPLDEKFTPWWGWSRIAWWHTDPTVPASVFWHPRESAERRMQRARSTVRQLRGTVAARRSEHGCRAAAGKAAS